MSRDETKRTMDAYIEALLGGGDFAQYLAPDILATVMETGETVRGRAPVRDFILALHGTMFTAHVEVVRLAADDDVAAVEAVFLGTHTGDFAGVSATGTKVRVPYTVFYYLADEGITELRVYWLMGGLIQQVEAGRTATAAPAP